MKRKLLAGFIGAALLTAAAPPPSTDAAFLREMQQLEDARNDAIRAGDLAVLKRIYAPDFDGINSDGRRVTQGDLLRMFTGAKPTDGGFTADSKVLSVQQIAPGILGVTGRLLLYRGAEKRLVSDSYYLHVFRRQGDHWEMATGASTPAKAN